MLTDKQYDRLLKAVQTAVEFPDYFERQHVSFAATTIERLNETGRKTGINKGQWGTVRYIEKQIKKVEAKDTNAFARSADAQGRAA